MAAPSKSFIVLADSAVDVDSPIDQYLVTALRDNTLHLEEWLGMSYTAAQDHDHDGTNSKSVVLADGVVTEGKLAANAVTNGKIAANAVTWGKISTGLQQSSGAGMFNFTGGARTLGWAMVHSGVFGDLLLDAVPGTGSYAWAIYLHLITGGTTGYFQASYINSSPPWDMGDGDIPLFVFVEVDSLGNVIKVDCADAPPWAYNGPTDIVPSRETADGRKYRRVKALIAEFGTLAAARASGLTRAQILNRLLNDDEVDEEITQAIKNRDMDLIPTPFPKTAPANTIVLLDPVSPLVRRLSILHHSQELDERLPQLLMDGRFNIGNTALTRATPPGVMVVSASLK